MKAARFHGRLDVRVEEVAEPGPPAPHELRLRVTRAAICGTDAGEYLHGPHQIPLHRTHPGSGHRGPMTLGHEFTGVVEAVGCEVEGFAVGDRVVPGAGMWCGECAWCAAGRHNLCARAYTLGLHADGGLAELVNVPTTMSRHVPDEVGDDGAALAQPLAVALHGLRRAGLEAGQSAVLIGAGGIGLFLLAGALERRLAQLVVVDVDPARLAAARALGAHATVDAREASPERLLRALGDDAGADVVLEASGTESGLALALGSVRRGGTVLLLGIQAAPRAVDLADLTVREIDLIGTNAHVCGVDVPEALTLLRDERIVDAAVARRIALDRFVEDGLEPFAAGRLSGKVLVDPAG